jgi:uncharacterized protein (TIGR00255 family)
MIRSMTGFGGASAQAGGARYVVEGRSVNNRYFKALIRLPEELQGLEAELEAALAKRLMRGSVTMIVRFSDASAEAVAQLNIEAIRHYIKQLRTVPGLEHNTTAIDLGALVALPGVVVEDAGQERLERARPVLLELVEEVCQRILGMRTREGEMLHAELCKHCRLIADQLAAINQRAGVVVELYQQRLRQRIEALVAESGMAIRDEDLLREVAVFAERSDVAEEVARMDAHLAHFREIIDNKGETPAGRSLEFLSQEMLREANTISGKSLDAEISRRIVDIKSAVDRIKEQVQNVE